MWAKRRLLSIAWPSLTDCALWESLWSNLFGNEAVLLNKHIGMAALFYKEQRLCDGALAESVSLALSCFSHVFTFFHCVVVLISAALEPSACLHIS